MPRRIRESRKSLWLKVAFCCGMTLLSGCAPMVMLGKMLQGDPMVEAEFTKWHGKPLAKSDKQVVILCSTPESIKTEYASLDIDLLSEISRRMSAHDIAVIKPHKVATWIDDHGLDDLDLKQLGNDLDADYVIEVKLDHFAFHEENSPNLFRGRTGGVVTAYELRREEQPLLKGKKSKSTSELEKPPSEKMEPDKKGRKKSEKSSGEEKKRSPVLGTKQIYNRTFKNVYPQLQPVSIEQMQAETFKKKFVDHVAEDLSRLFYSHKAGVGF